MTATTTRSTEVALFDVDGTLTRGTTMFRFLEYRMAAEGRSPGDYLRERRRLTELTRGGAPREVTNREYFTSYRGLAEHDILELGRAWFREEQSQGSFFHAETVRSLAWHQARGHLVVFVSGSFAACLDPIAEFLGVTTVLCSEPEISAGRFTGNVAVPMVADRKAAAVRDLLSNRDVRATWAYGDHSSDLPMLAAATVPIVVGGDPEFAAVAEQRGWQRVATSGHPLPTPRPTTLGRAVMARRGSE